MVNSSNQALEVFRDEHISFNASSGGNRLDTMQIQYQWNVYLAIFCAVLASVNWFFNKHRLNWPLIFTVIFDTTCMWSFFSYVMINYTCSRFTANIGALLVFILVSFLLLREAIYFAVMPTNIIGDVKRKGFPLSSDNVCDIIKYLTIFTALGYLLVYFNLTYCTWDGLYTLCRISLEYWILCLSKDETSMNVVHRWMHNHKNKWLYKCHERHHRAKAELSFFHLFLFDFSDVVVRFM